MLMGACVRVPTYYLQSYPRFRFTLWRRHQNNTFLKTSDSKSEQLLSKLTSTVKYRQKQHQFKESNPIQSLRHYIKGQFLFLTLSTRYPVQHNIGPHILKNKLNRISLELIARLVGNHKCTFLLKLKHTCE